MSGQESRKWNNALRWLGICSAAGLLVFTIVIVAGFYNVAASVPHYPLTRGFIDFALKRSVSFHSGGVEQPDLDNAALVDLGARYFEFGCAPCHGSPASPRNPVSRQMLPAAPALSRTAHEWTQQELHWIVRNGLKYTGMPAWAGEGRDQEVWPLIAFLQALPDMDAAGYRSAAAMDNPATEDGHADNATGENNLVEFCASCHGDADRPPVNPRVPGLWGQSQDYIRRSLTEYASGLRQSGMMEPIASVLSQSQIETLARDFSSRQQRMNSARASYSADQLQRGRRIALEGVKENNIPACLRCHSGGQSTQFPTLSGLSAEYLAEQLMLFQSGVRDGSTYGAVMTLIARRLSPEQTQDVVAYFTAAFAETAGTSSNAPREAM
jgi:cytochrome c553